MKTRIATLLVLLTCLACKDVERNPAIEVDHNAAVFNKDRWHTKSGSDYPYRNEMLYDVVYNLGLKGMPKEKLIELLGAPDRIENDHLYYTISHEKMMLLTLHIKTLVIKLDENGTVAWRKIHE